jgi:hypothetical protein
VYTVGDNVNLADVFHAMEKSSDSLPDTKDNDAVKKYFKKVYADIDFERVYNSDLKKMIKWFDVLKNNNIEIKLSEPEPEETEKEVMNEEKPEPVKNGKKELLTTKPETEKKTAKKSAKAASEKEEGKEEKKPAKKAAKKKEK